MPKIIGLTGGIGSGKTTVAHYFEALGIPIFIADKEAAKVMASETTIRLLEKEFGSQIIEGNQINRKALAAIVFNNPDQLQRLNAMVHPLVQQSFNKWLEKYTSSVFVIREAAILFESGSYLDCDKIITVTAPLQIRIDRVIKRDNSNPDDVLKRIENQWSDEKKIAKSDFVIHNTDLESTKNQVRKIYQELMSS